VLLSNSRERKGLCQRAQRSLSEHCQLLLCFNSAFVTINVSSFFFLPFFFTGKPCLYYCPIRMHKLAQNVLSASGGKRSPSDRDSENDETPELKKTKSEDIATATNTESPDVAESAIETVSSEAAAAAPKFKYMVKAKNLPHGQVKEMKNFFTNLGFSKFSKAPNQTHAFLSFPVSRLLL
jgi:hypothetical protein